MIATDGLSSPRILPLLDTLIEALFAAGLDDQQVVEGYSLLFQFTYGEAIDRHREQATHGQQMVRAADPTEFVHLGRILAAIPSGGTGDHFDVNLARLLDGLLDRPCE
ncbi:TetR/AcrR family transcriptional regulator C-terminal domain-containing protein [Pseudonocardia sichuanensis]|uniref:TetR/AcrR family transcriptional regulator C-terminal domain-containing protein n=1 Tax=Pseudonocardia kunmingensis TaxID=630975 RepID=UPI00319E1640